MNDIARLIVHSSLGAELTDAEVEVLGTLMTERVLTDGDFLIKDGTTDDALHVILIG